MEYLSTLLTISAFKSPKKYDLEQIKKAWEFANLAHTGQFRKSGEPFINHPTHTAISLINWGLDTESVMAGILHDTVEDGGATRDDLAKEFGENVANLVDGVTNISDVRLKGSRDQNFVENLRKMLLVMAKDIRVVIIKLADRLHNMQTLGALPPDKQKKISIETLDIYAKLADRLGMSEIAGSLEDLAFPYIYPEDYKKLAEITLDLVNDAKAQVEKLKQELESLISKQIPNVKILARQKHLYSLFRKLDRPEIAGDMSKIHDLVAARILVDTIPNCYVALGLVHGKYHPVPYLGISDYIATPKANGYKSIHTKVFGPDGQIIEIQIRTHEMHEEAEMGVAAHWSYNEKKSSGVSDAKLESGVVAPIEKLLWVKQLMSWQKEISDNDEYLHTLKFDALQHRILVFSPVGDVYDLPYGSTPIDYAYAVHTGLGHQAVGAKINNKMVGLGHKLNNGDVVEIIIDEKRLKPNPDWLSMVATRTAKSAISKTLKH